MSGFAIVVGMEEDAQATTPAPSTPVGGVFKVGDLVQVFQGTGHHVVGRKAISYIGRIVGYNESEGKWVVRKRLTQNNFLTQNHFPI